MGALLTTLASRLPGGEATLFVAGSTLAQGLTALAAVSLFALADRRGWLDRYRYADDKPPKPELLAEARREVSLAYLTLPLVFGVVYPGLRAAGLRVDGPLPSALELAWQLPFFVIVQDTVFYWSHRLLHRPWWFRRVHAHHHRFKGTRGVAHGFTHPVETAFNLLAMYAGPLLVSTHLLTFWLWLVLRTLETVDAHSGFCLPWSPWSPRHHWHHRHVHGCYGSFFGIWDRLMGTDAAQRGAQAGPG